MSLPRYPKYKDSGVEWLGEVPAHWRVGRCGFHLSVLSGFAFPSEGFTQDDGATRLLRGINVGVSRLKWEEPVYWHRGEGDGLAIYELRADDLVIGMDRPLISEGMRVAKVKESDLPCLLLQRVARLKLRDSLDVDLMLYLLSSQMFIAHFSPETTGVSVPHISPGQVTGFVIPLPPLPEQLLIVGFLDREVTKIDALMSEQRKLIGLLKEKREAVISHVVTKGLNSDAPMKDSGVAWLGEVPSHWRCLRSKVLFVEVDERSESHEGELLTVSHITGVTRRSEKDVTMTLAETLIGYKICIAGDLVINTMWAWMGALGCSRLNGLVSPSYNVYRPRSGAGLVPEYYDYLCRIPSHVAAIKARSSGVWESRLRLYPDAFLDMRLVVPPEREQRAIVAHLDELTRVWNSLIDEAERAVDLLQERRAALISAAVTGQIDVRPASERRAS